MDSRGTAHLIYQPIPSTNVSTNLENLTCEKIPISALLSISKITSSVITHIVY